MPSPPQCQSTVNNISVLSDKESKVIGVSVYNGRAEITRETNVSVKVGQNNVTIVGLSTYLDVNSMRYIYFLPILRVNHDNRLIVGLPLFLF